MAGECCLRRALSRAVEIPAETTDGVRRHSVCDRFEPGEHFLGFGQIFERDAITELEKLVPHGEEHLDFLCAASIASRDFHSETSMMVPSRARDDRWLADPSPVLLCGALARGSARAPEVLFLFPAWADTPRSRLCPPYDRDHGHYCLWRERILCRDEKDGKR